jgi:hypothetical protein
VSIDSVAVRAAAEIQTWFEAIFEGLTDFSSTIGPAIVATRGRRKRFVDADLKPVKALAVKFLAANPVVEGAGMLVAPGGIHENRGTIDWWRHDDEGTDSKVLRRLRRDGSVHHHVDGATGSGTGRLGDGGVRHRSRRSGEDDGSSAAPHPRRRRAAQQRRPRDSG